MPKIKFDPKELTIVREIPNRVNPNIKTPVFATPVSLREGYIANVKRDPIWQPTNIEGGLFTPEIYPDNVARAFVYEHKPFPKEKYGGKDMFGLEWVFVEVTGGSIVRPGKPHMSDVNEWKDKVVFPNIDAWDWAGSAAANKEHLSSGVFYNHWILNGYFERLIAFMDFEGAALAMIDDDQKDALKAFFSALTDFYCKIIDKFVDNYHAEGFCFHDDWGSQMAPFFSPAVCKEMIVPYMRRLTDHMHSRGCLADLHSCGHVEQQVPNMIEAGWDTWTPMPMNDTHKLYDVYGEKLTMGVVCTPLPADASLDDQRAAARDWVKKFCNPKKPALFSSYGPANLAFPAFREELYVASRKFYGGA